MKQKSYKFFSKYTIFIIVVSCVLNGIIWIVFHGIPIVGIPKVEEVESITIYYNDVQQQEIVEKEKIELLIKASNLLNYKFGRPRLPLIELSKSSQVEIKKVMKKHKLI